MDPDVSLAEQLRHVLAELELSQAELARRTGISRGTINKIVNAKRSPNAAQLGSIAYELGLDLRELLALGDLATYDELELLGQQLREAVLRAQRAERARAELRELAAEREASLGHELATLTAAFESLTRERDELRARVEQAEVGSSLDEWLEQEFAARAPSEPARIAPAEVLDALAPSHAARADKADAFAKIAGEAVGLLVSTMMFARSLRT